MAATHPTFVETKDAALVKYGDGLRAIIGATLVNTWIAWHRTYDEWFSDEAVILRFGARNLEASFNQLSQLGITWDTVDVACPPNWMGCWEGVDLEWRSNAHPAIVGVIGKQLTDIAIVEYRFRTTVFEDRDDPKNIGVQSEAWMLHAIEFQFDDRHLVLYNALDENGFQTEPLCGSDYVKVWLSEA